MSDDNESALAAMLPPEVSSMLRGGALSNMFSGSEPPDDSPAGEAVAAARDAADRVSEMRRARRTVRHSDMFRLEDGEGREGWAKAITAVSDLTISGEGRGVVIERLKLDSGYMGYVEWDTFEEVDDVEKK